MRLALIIEYDGSQYHGFQYQVNASTIQDELQKALGRFVGVRTNVKGSGRTDAGVHAERQVVAFDTGTNHDEETFIRALNFYLPEDIAVKEAYRVRSDFDPRGEAISREYRYTILNSRYRSPLWIRYACQLTTPLNVKAMDKAARGLEGEHDFSAFSSHLNMNKGSAVRNVYRAKVTLEGEKVLFDVKANAFLYHQVRRMMGALVQVGFGKITQKEFSEIGCGGTYDPYTMPPNGLCLMKINYKDFPPKADQIDGYE